MGKKGEGKEEGKGRGKKGGGREEEIREGKGNERK